MGCTPSKQQTADTAEEVDKSPPDKRDVANAPLEASSQTNTNKLTTGTGTVSREATRNNSINSKGNRRNKNDAGDTKSQSAGGSSSPPDPDGSNATSELRQHQHPQNNGSSKNSSSSGGGNSISHSKSNGVSPSMSKSAGTSHADQRWTRTWESLYPKLLDPADVHSAVEDLMAGVTNKLSATELTFLQRKVRSVIRLAATKTNAREGKMMGRILNNNTNETEGRVIAERYHLLSHHVVKKILPSASCLPMRTSPSSPNTAIDPAEASYLLMSHLHESYWDRTAEIAAQSAKRAGLDMDVNKQKPVKVIPFPPSPLEETSEGPPGASFHSLAFLIALALSK